MFTLTKQENAGILSVHLVGDIDETVHLERSIGAIKGKLRVLTRGVVRINSAGTRNWIHYFESLRSQNIEFWFEECSPAIVDQLNLISNFRAGARVESIYLPFICEKCRSELIGLFSCEALIAKALVIPSQACSKCGGAARFDEIHEEYLGFLRRMGSD